MNSLDFLVNKFGVKRVSRGLALVVFVIIVLRYSWDYAFFMWFFEKFICLWSSTGRQELLSSIMYLKVDYLNIMGVCVKDGFINIDVNVLKKFGRVVIDLHSSLDCDKLVQNGYIVYKISEFNIDWSTFAVNHVIKLKNLPLYYDINLLQYLSNKPIILQFELKGGCSYVFKLIFTKDTGFEDIWMYGRLVELSSLYAVDDYDLVSDMVWIYGYNIAFLLIGFVAYFIGEECRGLGWAYGVAESMGWDWFDSIFWLY